MYHINLNYYLPNMAIERTLAILKPDCVRKNLQGAVLKQIQDAGFKILAMKMTRLTADTAGGFYAVHRERPFFGELVAFMSSGACVPVALEKENAVADYRKLIGATDPAEAQEGTVRKLYADSKGENIVHGSDSVENANIEIAYFFAESELVANNA
jgi:nucleoside-diphosphate kinase